MFHSKRWLIWSLAGCLLAAIAVFQLPFVKSRLQWRYEVWSTYLQNMVNPVDKMPTPLPSTPFATFTPLPPTATVAATELPTATATPLPAQAILPRPKYE